MVQFTATELRQALRTETSPQPFSAAGSNSGTITFTYITAS